MLETEKIAAPILAIGYATQHGGGIKTRNYIELYEEFLGELSHPNVRKAANADERPNDSSSSIVRQNSRSRGIATGPDQ
jgi:hypothetical protein